MPAGAGMKVLALLDRYDYTAWWRVLRPFVRLCEHGIEARQCLYSAVGRGLQADAQDLIITPRVTFAGNHWIAAWLRERRRAGARWVYEADDDMWCQEFAYLQVEVQAEIEGRDLPRPERRRLFDRYDQERQRRRELLSRCDGVTVSTPELARRVGYLTHKPIEVIPNLIDVEVFEHAMGRHPRMVPGLTIGWAGGSRRERDFLPLVEAWPIVARRYPQVTFVIYGSVPTALAAAVPEDQLATIDWAPLDLYPAGLKNIDIACCVLPDSDFNRSKSANKWLEFSLAGAASVVSPTVYSEVVTHNEDGLVVKGDSVDEWVVALSELIEDQYRRTALAFQAGQTVRKCYDLATRWTCYTQAWDRILTAA